MGSIIHYLVTWTLELDPFFENFNLLNNFWKVSARALIFYTSIPREETFLWVPLSMTLWPWPWSLIHFLKTLTLVMTFEQWVLEFWYFTWIFLVVKPRCGYYYFLPWPWRLTYLLYHMSISSDSTRIKIFVPVTLAIFGIGHYRGHFCFTSTYCYILI